MRYYSVNHTQYGTPYIEAEVNIERILHEFTIDFVTREQALKDPVLKSALEQWDRRDDVLAAVNESEDALRECAANIHDALAAILDVVPLAQDFTTPGTDQAQCVAVMALLPLLDQALVILEPFKEPIDPTKDDSVSDVVGTDA